LGALLFREMHPASQVFADALLLFRRQIPQGFGLLLQPVAFSR
jgi:hypothetical protein